MVWEPLSNVKPKLAENEVLEFIVTFASGNGVPVTKYLPNLLAVLDSENDESTVKDVLFPIDTILFIYVCVEFA